VTDEPADEPDAETAALIGEQERRGLGAVRTAFLCETDGRHLVDGWEGRDLPQSSIPCETPGAGCLAAAESLLVVIACIERFALADICSR
jgi:hypothetical protein